ncbi:MAG TPA: alanine--tRNA ligase [Candidatus Sulfotelmatobacter sp.]|nr:alanine--tRNA ligase [Candidatus Sulfotelmatobacter sp.]
MPTGSEIRRKFLDFFVHKGHKEVHSSSLVPANDPTLLFTNAGMNQFKDVFLGLEKRDYSRATTSQKCVRAGGKHNDLENVGFTNRHHTFFEMLGNFSFGDYFKKDAIAYAWELITSPEWFGIAKEKLYVTIFEGAGPLEAGFDVPRDDEAERLWLDVGVPKERIFAFGMKDNFWQMGDTGPCGPCSEIHYDMGVAASDQGHTDCAFGCDCGRYVEIWNLVFMQYDRQVGVTRQLPKPSIDTGMGLERVAAVLQGVISNYDTDLFTPLIKRAAELTGTSLTRELNKEAHTKSAASLRVIADHSRAATFLISDGVLPANDGRGYVLRKIIRRAITHGRLQGQTRPFLYEMVFAVRDLMRDAFPELNEKAERVSKAVQVEETRFAQSLGVALRELYADIAAATFEEWDRHEREIFDGIALSTEERDLLEGQRVLLSVGRSENDDDTARAIKYFVEKLDQRLGVVVKLPGDRAFRLYDTFGLPRDFIEDACRDLGIVFDQDGFDRAMEEQKSRARASWKGAAKQTANPAYQQLPKSEFKGYRQTRSDGCEVLAIIHDGHGAQELKAGESGEIILDQTPFYAESGGQVGDRGWLYSDDHNTVIADVKGCYYPIQGVRAHQVVVKSPLLAQSAREKWGTLRVGDRVDAVVDTERRVATMRNHTATHLLHAGLREVLGKHVKQAGSLVAPDHLRFDFSHFTAVEDEELQDIEDLINKELLRNVKVETLTDVPIDEAINTYHAMALFGEKYGDKVRVVRIGDFSTELCGGTHTAATGEIGLIKILKEGSVSSGVRRVEAITGLGSLAHFRRDHELENVVSSFVSPTLAQKTRKNGAPSAEEIPAHAETVSPAEALKAELEKKDSEIKRLTRELDSVRMKSASASTADIGERVKEVKGVKVLAHRVDNLERAQLRTLVDQLRDKIGSGVVVLGSASDGNVALIVGVTKDLTGRVQAGKVIGPVAQKVGGKGGGRPDLAEAGGKDASALDAALDGVYDIVDSLLGT